jgi:hypothetical protein
MIRVCLMEDTINTFFKYEHKLMLKIVNAIRPGIRKKSLYLEAKLHKSVN